MKKLLIRLTMIPFAVLATVYVIFYSLSYIVIARDLNWEFLDKWFEWIENEGS